MVTLFDFLMSYPEIEYNEENKAEFKRLGQRFLKRIRAGLNEDGIIAESKISFNPGVIAVSGDHGAYIMFTSGKGVYVNISVQGTAPEQSFMTRSITSLTDYSGGQNHWHKFSNLGSDQKMKTLLRR